MKRVCAWCKKIMAEGPEPVTHGMCELCLAKMKKEIDSPEIQREIKKLSGG